MRLAALAWKIERTPSVAAFADRLDRTLAEVAARGAELVLLPEYAPVEVGATRAAGRGARAEVAEAAALAPALEDAMAALAARHGVWLLGGSLPAEEDGRLVNRATLFAPDRRRAVQRKCTMTRFEAEEWGVTASGPPQVIETPWGRIGIAICYDAEFPPIVRAMARAGAWLVLVPACTDTEAGATRVTVSARARAIENQAVVAVAPTVGDAPWCASLDANRGRAGLYGPADRGFPPDGIIAEGPRDAPGAVIAALDPAAIAAVREHGAVRNHRDWPAEPVACAVVAPAAPVPA
ncbi:carbon-nitrogen hydrolase family protein [Elioraea sp.]|jgi:predicted amidohydrolase|uniref:carbon-nitrogen hydrolase family protein n=1 Tax=Elioraea sp. TaxID=2185103 RepID=UPI0021DD1520|nr:carbon-nitrogen hydrolase family protein [Elioraea sp.]GIX09755.1 MAG: amidohydrolase [Elioraea sp.]